MSWRDNQWSLSFQSRFGPEKWLEPYTEAVLTDLHGQGVERPAVFSPGFVTDCLETLEEIAMQNAERFHAAGGGELRYIPALNDADEHVTALAAVVRDHLGGWRATLTDDELARAAAAARALELGAPR